MDPREHRAAELKLSLLEAVLAAFERRHEVVEAVWGARDRDEAEERVRELLDLRNGADPGVVLDMQIERLTSQARDEVAANVTYLRDLLGRT